MAKLADRSASISPIVWRHEKKSAAAIAIQLLRKINCPETKPTSLALQQLYTRIIVGFRVWGEPHPLKRKPTTMIRKCSYLNTTISITQTPQSGSLKFGKHQVALARLFRKSRFISLVIDTLRTSETGDPSGPQG